MSVVQTSSVTEKGQITIPARLRKQLGINPGDKVAFALENDHIVLTPLESSVEAAFGLVKPRKSASLEDIETAIKSRAGK